METETLDKLYLEWSQITKARTSREIRYERSLRSIADWHKVNISGEHDGGLRDIIKSIVHCAQVGLES